MGNSKYIVFTLLILLFTVNCSKENKTIEEEELNIAVINNNTHGEWEIQKKNTKLKHISSIHGGNVNNPFYNPTAIALDRLNNIYVVDEGNKILIFNKKGDLIKIFGRFGNGPGEFSQISSLVICNNADIYISDYGNRKVHVYNRAGEMRNSFNINGINLFIKLDLNNNIYISPFVFSQEKSGGVIKKYNENWKLLGEIGTYKTSDNPGEVLYNNFVAIETYKNFVYVNYVYIPKFEKYSLANGQLISVSTYKPFNKSKPLKVIEHESMKGMVSIEDHPVSGQIVIDKLSEIIYIVSAEVSEELGTRIYRFNLYGEYLDYIWAGNKIVDLCFDNSGFMYMLTETAIAKYEVILN